MYKVYSSTQILQDTHLWLNGLSHDVSIKQMFVPILAHCFRLII